jgi:predicted ATPase
VGRILRLESPENPPEQIRGFRCLGDIDVAMSDLTILLGGNNAGKSIFLRALSLSSSTACQSG